MKMSGPAPPTPLATRRRPRSGYMGWELVTASVEELDRLQVIRKVVEGALSQLRAALLLGLTAKSAGSAAPSRLMGHAGWLPHNR